MKQDDRGYYRPSQRDWDALSEHERLVIAAKNLVNAVQREHRPKEPALSLAIRDAIGLVGLALTSGEDARP